MLQHKSSKLLLAVAMFGILAFATQGFSQGNCYWDSWEMGAGAGWWNYKIPTQYSLSPDQITRMNDIRTQNQQQILPLQNQLSSLRIEMRGYASGNDADVNKIKEYRNQIRDLEDKISDLRLNSRSEMNKILTKEQRAYLNQGNYGWWDMDNGWWHMGRGMMSDYGYNDCDYDMRGRGMVGNNWRGGCW